MSPLITDILGARSTNEWLGPLSARTTPQKTLVSFLALKEVSLVFNRETLRWLFSITTRNISLLRTYIHLWFILLCYLDSSNFYVREYYFLVWQSKNVGFTCNFYIWFNSISKLTSCLLDEIGHCMVTVTAWIIGGQGCGVSRQSSNNW